MKKAKFEKNIFVLILSKLFLKETTIKKDGTEVRGLTVFGYMLIIGTVVAGLVVLEKAGVIDDVVSMFGHKSHAESHEK